MRGQISTLWANTFERSSRDVLALQAELASAIARELNVRLTRRVDRERQKLDGDSSLEAASHTTPIPPAPTWRMSS
jgi:hypothetical protein